MTDIDLLERIADQAAVVRQRQRAYYANRDPARKTPLLRDSLEAEKALDRLLAIRAGAPAQPALFADSPR